MEWLFWGWFRCFIQYAFYQVIAASRGLYHWNLMLGALRLPPAGTLSTVQTHRLVSGPLHYVSRFDLQPS